MQLFQFAGKGVNILVCEFGFAMDFLVIPRRARRPDIFSHRFTQVFTDIFLESVFHLCLSVAQIAEATHDVEHVQRPAAFLDGEILERLDAFECVADFGRRGKDGFETSLSLILPFRSKGRHGQRATPPSL